MRVWAVSEDNAGTVTQALGVAERLGGEVDVVRLSRRPLWRRLASLHIAPRKLEEPDVIVSCGIFAEAFVSRAKRRFAGRPLAVHLQPPGKRHDAYDLVLASSHDWSPAHETDGRFHRVLGVAHRIRSEDLARMRAAARAEFASGGSRVLLLLVGGPNGAYGMDRATGDAIVSLCRTHAAQGWTVLVTTSRRTPAAVAAAVASLKDRNIHVWTGGDDNPYRRFLAAADALVVTADSISMLCEATATGRPVHRLDLPRDEAHRAAKFDRFHADMEAAGLVRPYAGEIGAWTCGDPDEAGRIAGLIRDEIARRSSDRQ